MNISSIFGGLTKEVQLRIDAASQANKQLFQTNYVGRLLEWGSPMMSSEFTSLLGKYGLVIAAPTIDDGSPEPVVGEQLFSKYRGKTFTHAVTIPLSMAERRSVLQILDSRRTSLDKQAEALADMMMRKVVLAVDGVYAKLNMIFLGSLSNKGVYTFSDKNNPEGAVRDKLDFGMPSSNCGRVTIDWTSSNSSNVDPFEDIQAIIDKANAKTSLSKILITQNRLSFILRSHKMKQVIFGTDKSSSPLLLSNLNTFMEQNGFPTFEVVRNTYKVFDPELQRYVEHTPFNDKMLVFIPDGKLGVIENTFADGELEPNDGVAYSTQERVLISQWSVGKKEGVTNKVDYTSAESISIPVPTEIEAIYNLQVEA